MKSHFHIRLYQVMSTAFEAAALIALANLAAAAPVFASRGADGANMAMLRHDTEDATKIKLVRIEGALSCDLGAENNGQSCELKLRESKTGRIYNLIQAKSAMQLFQDGKKNVLIEGRLEDSETLEVRNAQISTTL